MDLWNLYLPLDLILKLSTLVFYWTMFLTIHHVNRKTLVVSHKNQDPVPSFSESSAKSLRHWYSRTYLKLYAPCGSNALQDRRSGIIWLAWSPDITVVASFSNSFFHLILQNVFQLVYREPDYINQLVIQPFCSFTNAENGFCTWVSSACYWNHWFLTHGVHGFSNASNQNPSELFWWAIKVRFDVGPMQS